jgi:hypothetical protein
MPFKTFIFRSKLGSCPPFGLGFLAENARVLTKFGVTNGVGIDSGMRSIAKY